MRVPDATKRRHAQLAATKKKIAKPARMNSAVGKPVSSVGIRSIHAPIATSVSTSTAMTGSKVAGRYRQTDCEKIDDQHKRPDQSESSVS